MYKIYGSACTSEKPFEAYKSMEKGSKTRIIASTEHFEKPVDSWWLKSASEAYRISDDISDYVVVPVGIVTVDIPNRNLQCFPYEEVTAFNEDAGRVTYQTFIGKPLFLNHKNDDCRQAKGVILDSVLKHIPEYDIWKIFILTAWDRTKDKDVVNHILKDPKSEYSMGSYVKTFIEYPTGKQVTPKSPRGTIDKDGNLIYHLCLNSYYFETSLILEAEGAADCTATNTQNEILIRPDELKELEY